MKKLVFLSIGMLAIALQPAANAQTSLFTTYDDWSQWSASSGSTVSADNAFSTDASTINGIGNTTAPGATGTSGSLSIQWASAVGGFNSIATAPYEGGSQAFLSAVDPGSSVSGNTAVAATGNIYLDYSLPSTVSGSYFQLGIVMQYAANGYYGTFFSSSTTDLGFMDPNNEEVYQATIPYTFSAGQFNGFGFGIMYNSNYAPALPFHVDAMSVSAVQTVPEPGTIALIGMGLSGLVFIRRRRQS